MPKGTVEILVMLVIPEMPVIFGIPVMAEILEIREILETLSEMDLTKESRHRGEQSTLFLETASVEKSSKLTSVATLARTR